MPFNWVEYDGNPDRVIEPVSHHETFRQTIGGTSNYLATNPFTDGVGLVAGIEIVDAVPLSEVQEFHMV